MAERAPDRVVIIGGGQAGCQAAASLRQLGHAGEIVIIAEEPDAPYQRPPLSKAYLKGEIEAERLLIRPESFYAEERIELRLGERVTAIDRAARRVTTDAEQGEAGLGYNALIIATGTRPRRLAAPGAGLGGVFELRTRADVERLKPALKPGERLCVVGAGYIGLETAAAARALGCEVTVIEAMDRVLSRVAGEELSAFFANEHRSRGVQLRLGARLEAFEGAGSVSGVRLAGGEVIGCDVVIVGVGVIANDEIAREAGLVCDDGIVVDRAQRTSDAAVFAIGDVARRPLVHFGDRMMRLESVHNAIEGGKIAAAAILGAPHPAEDAPWFWSDQYDLKLQTAGLWTGADATVVRGDPAERSFAVFYLQAGRLIAVDAVNAAPEYIVGKKLVSLGAMVAPGELADKSVAMKDIAARALART
ncbi:pyridine nucleotide-disulfide oxidoreductase [bacterium]|nr:pyridine nucleotide-disulfide oxidoreductase [bacterium]